MARALPLALVCALAACPRRIEPVEHTQDERDCVAIRVLDWGVLSERPFTLRDLRDGPVSATGRACKRDVRHRLERLTATPHARAATDARMLLEWEGASQHNELGVSTRCEFFGRHGESYGRDDMLLLDLVAELPGMIAVDAVKRCRLLCESTPASKDAGAEP